MTHPSEIFETLQDNSNSTMADYASEYLDPGNQIDTDDDPEELATEFVKGACSDWFTEEVAEHGEETVIEALTVVLEAYIEQKKEPLGELARRLGGEEA